MVVTMLEIIDVACMRGERELFSGLNFTVTPGLLFAIVGENGSGKSSLLRMLSGLLPSARGVIRWNGTAIDEVHDDYRRHLTYLGHLNGIKDDLTPVENLQISAELFGDDHSATAAREALQAVGLGRHTEGLPTRVLSQGQKRRVALARLWLSKRPVWILDEPFAALDDAGTALLTERLARHLETGGMAVVATHQAVGVRDESLRSLRLS
ncbi:hypothetical protein B566_EDAN000618 [Ephemera danica]|nr:hypothetical protein B566_EDAN000618 [Ephemera danica]